MTSIITNGVSYAQLLNDLREVVRQEVSQATNQQTSGPEVGGIQLAMEVTGYSKSHLHMLVSKRAIPSSKRLGRLYFNRAELLAWVAEGNRATADGLGKKETR